VVNQAPSPLWVYGASAVSRP